MLTFEKIRDIERAEHESKKLQKLPENFFEDLKEYLRRKERITEKTSSDIIELENARSIIRRLFESREKKLMEMALYTARTGIPSENLARNEEKTFFFLVDELRRLRETFFEELQKEPARTEGKDEIPENQRAEDPPQISDLIQKRTVYRVRKSMPAFVGPDMQTYELKEGETVQLPEALNEFLLKEGVIERIEE
ncbi:MAG: DNA replication complex GINS family protein [Candidatus Aenigmarchaeota archaeon]|nr:DNA replication complex GINS family protein [Candidatus Aenigmarchaeota archaeon]